MVPIALMIVLEITKIISTLFIEHDYEMMSTELDLQSKCLTFSLHEDLGVLGHVFADKTGTLTANKLTPRGISVGGEVYKFDEMEIKKIDKNKSENFSKSKYSRKINFHELVHYPIEIEPHLVI